MTDELSLQQQQVGNYAVPGLVGGAVIGGAGGAATSYWTNLGYKSKADYDKVIAMKEDTFKKQIENAGDNKGNWEKAQELVKKVKDAEAEYDKIVEEAKKSGTNLADLPDGDVKTTLENATNRRNAAIEAEKKKLALNNSGAKVELKPASEMHAPASFSGTRAEFVADYGKMYRELQDAITNAKNKAAYIDAKDALDAREKLIKDLYKKAGDKAEATGNVERAFTQKKMGTGFFDRILDSVCSTLGITKDKSIYGDINKIVTTEILQEPTELNAETIKGLGEFIAEKDSKNLPKLKTNKKELIQVKDSAGKLQGYVILDKGTYADKLAEVQKEVKAEQKALTDEYFAKAKQKYEAELKIKNFDTAFETSKAKRLTNAGTNLTTIKAEMANYEADIVELEKIKGVTRDKLADTAILDKYDASGTKQPKDILNIIKERKNIADSYTKELNKLKEQAAKFIDNDKGIASLQEQLEKVLYRDKDVKKKRGKIRYKYPEFFPAGTKLTEDEIVTKAEEAVSKMKVHTDYEAAKKAAEEELTKLGKGGELTGDALTEAIKKKANGAGSKEEYTKKIAEEAKTEIEKMAKDLKIKNHWVTAAIGAGALALIGLGIGASQKKTAPVAEEA